MIGIVEPRKFQVLARLLIFLHNADSSTFITSSLQKYRILHIAMTLQLPHALLQRLSDGVHAVPRVLS